MCQCSVGGRYRGTLRYKELPRFDCDCGHGLVHGCRQSPREFSTAPSSWPSGDHKNVAVSLTGIASQHIACVMWYPEFYIKRGDSHLANTSSSESSIDTREI